MVCQKLEYNKSNLTKLWLFAFYKIYVKKGFKLKAYNWLKLFIVKLIKTIKQNINLFFIKLHKKFSLRVAFLKRVVAGKVVKIPFFMKKQNKIWFYAKFVLKSLNERAENTYLDKLVNELVDITKNVGITLKKYLEFQKDIKIALPNLRFVKK